MDEDCTILGPRAGAILRSLGFRSNPMERFGQIHGRIQAMTSSSKRDLGARRDRRFVTPGAYDHGRGERVTIPSLPDVGHWQAHTDARLRLGPNLSHNHPADRTAATAPRAA